MSLIIRTDTPLLQDKYKIMHVIADFWDNISEGWREIWGPHIHHGYYENNQTITPLQAQEILIEKLSALLNITRESSILDAGCGMGGSSIYLAKKYAANVTGVTLSIKQAMMAANQCKLENIQHVNFKVEDALSLKSFEDNSMDIVWSLESCEQFYDKNLFIQQAYRVLKPGGKLMLATWCSDRNEYQGSMAKKYIKLCQAFDLPYMPSMAVYQELLKTNDFNILNAYDWSTCVKKSWDIGISLVNAYSLFKILKISGWRGLRFTNQIKLMRNAFAERRVKYGVFIASKMR